MMKNGARSRVLGIVTLVVSGLLAGCSSSAAERAHAPAPPSGAPYIESDIPPANQPTPSPRAEVTSVQGADGVIAKREFSTAAKRLRDCPNVEKVPLRIQVQNRDGRTAITFVDQGSQKLSGDARRCVLDAMSTINVDDLATGGSPSNRPSGFTANVVLSWF
jgi:hypothetical protein